jgi:hypothetical protein
MDISNDHWGAMKEAVLEINITAFKAKCLELFKQLEARRFDKVVVTRRG